MISRCCNDTLRWRVANLNGPFVDGMEIPCRWCEGVWTFTAGAWAHRDATAQVVERLMASLPSARQRLEEERAKRLARES